MIHPGEAALVVVGEESAHRAIKLARLTSTRQSERTGSGSYAEVEQEVLSALNEHKTDPSST